MTMADTVAVMNAGRIEQMGAPEALYDLPKTAFVATFLGQSNLTKGTASKDGDWVTFAYAQERFGVPAARAAKTSGEVLLGVRPEKCRVHESNPGPSTEQRSVMGPATVLDVSFIGVATNYLVRSPAGNTWAIYEQNMDVEPQHLKPGDDVWVSWAPQHAFIVDDGERALLDEEAAS